MLGDSLRRRHDAPDADTERPARARKRSAGGSRRFGWKQWLLAVLLVPLVAFGVGYLISTQILFPKPETAGAGIPVPTLFGVDRAEAERRLAEAGLGVGEVVALVNPESAPGRVLAQDPVPGQQLREGGAVSFAVSTGAAEVRVPLIQGLDAVVAEEMLQRAGLSVQVRQTRTVDVRKGAVLGTEPASGTVVKLPAEVILVVSAGPPVVDSAALPLDSPAPAPAPARTPAPDSAGPGG